MLCYYGDDMGEYRRSEDNIKMDLKEISVDVMDWMKSTKYRDNLRAFYAIVLDNSGIGLRNAILTMG